jgi:hypothetical protein
MVMNKLNEDFTKLYKRWKGGNVRKEDKIDKEEVRKFINGYYINKDNVTIHETCVDFDESVILGTIYELTFKFGKVSGGFDAGHIDIDDNDMKFMPEYVGGDFNISGNRLKSFKGCPEEVGGNFLAVGSHNLESLEGLPKHIGGYLFVTTDEKGKFTKEDIPEGTVIDGRITIQ